MGVVASAVAANEMGGWWCELDRTGAAVDVNVKYVLLV
jgi:hypothetical protein